MVRHMKQLLTILCLFLLVSCSNEVPSHRLIENGGVTYEIGSNDPFTGVSIGYKNGVLTERVNFKKGKQEGPRKIFFENGQLKETIPDQKNTRVKFSPPG